MIPVITAFADSPDRGRGFTRDMRVRWALAEVGAPYEVRSVTFGQLKEPAHRAIQPFGQIPTYEDGEVALFETGAIVLAIAERHAGLLPADPAARWRAISWMFAAVGTLEPAIVEREMSGHVERDADWYEKRLPIMDGRIRARLADLSACLGARDWLEEDFCAGDLMVIDVLRRLHASDVMAEFGNLTRYVARGEERPAFKTAYAAQHAAYLAAVARRGS